MYVHPAFRIDQDRALALLQDCAFGTLVVSDPTSLPVAVHLPFLTSQREDGSLRLEMHIARANCLHELVAPGGQPALVTCQGPNAYISPDWYGVPNQVPTWTYTAIHLSGILHALPEEDGAAHVDRLSAEFENRLLPKPAWTSDKMVAERRAAMIRAIVTFEMVVAPDGIQAQEKLIQHKGATEHRGAISGLLARGDPGSVAVAALMEKGLANRTTS